MKISINSRMKCKGIKLCENFTEFMWNECPLLCELYERAVDDGCEEMCRVKFVEWNFNFFCDKVDCLCHIARINGRMTMSSCRCGQCNQRMKCMEAAV